MRGSTPEPALSVRPSFGHIAIEDIEPASYQEILRTWCEQREGRAFPLTEKIDPFLVPSLVPNLILYDVQGPMITFRLVGEKVLTTAGTNPKGMTLIEAFGDTPYIRMVEVQLRECVRTGIPLYSRHDFQVQNGSLGTKHSRKAWRIALPYGTEERVTRLLCYQLFSEEIDLPARKDIDFDKLLPKTVFKIDV